MFNSTIIPKKKVCVKCGRPCYWFSNRMCKQCATIVNTQARMEENKEKRDELEIWFDAKAHQILLNPYCVECGEKIWPTDYRNCTPHLLEKRHFDSIKTHPMNWTGPLCVKGNGCHYLYDRAWSDSQTMKIWEPIVVPRFKILYPLIPKEEHQFIPECLLQTI